jgi:RNA-directed DNA polymerase
MEPEPRSTHLAHQPLTAEPSTRYAQRSACQPAPTNAHEQTLRITRPCSYGVPTSPALANLAAFGLDRRLAGLAASMSLRYSRYAYDLTFSGPAQLRRRRRRVVELVDEIAREEGFAVNARKTALHSAGGRQSVCGVVVNVRPNVLRSEYHELKAILHNAARDGPDSQNRARLPDFQGHLRGRISWVASLNPSRGEKLRRRFDEISW